MPSRPPLEASQTTVPGHFGTLHAWDTFEMNSGADLNCPGTVPGAKCPTSLPLSLERGRDGHGTLRDTSGGLVLGAMCHPLDVDVVDIDMKLAGGDLKIESLVRCEGKTGVEMEAMVAVSVAALTVYDMCKSAGKGITIEHKRLLEKTGGKSGHWKVQETE